MRNEEVDYMGGPRWGLDGARLADAPSPRRDTVIADEREYDEIVGLIYDAAVAPLQLKHALSRIVQAVEAAGAHLVGFRPGSREVVLSVITGLSPLGEIDYNERYARIDPRVPVFLGAAAGTWGSCHYHFDQAFVDRSEFFQDFLIPYGSRYVSAVKLIESDECTAVLGVHRNAVQRPLSDVALAFLERLTPHLQRAMRLMQDHVKLQDQWTVVKATLDMLDYAALVCDENGELLVTNEAAAATLEQHDGLSLEDGRLFVQHAPARASLRALLLGERTDERRTDGAAGAVLIERPSGLPAYQLIGRRIQAERSLLGCRDRSLWSMMISDPARASVPTMRAISVLYGLTPAETRLATLLISGANPEEIAARGGVKLATIRTQLSSLFSKTGSRRQAELVRLISAVPALHELKLPRSA